MQNAKKTIDKFAKSNYYIIKVCELQTKERRDIDCLETWRPNKHDLALQTKMLQINSEFPGFLTRVRRKVENLLQRKSRRSANYLREVLTTCLQRTKGGEGDQTTWTTSTTYNLQERSGDVDERYYIYKLGKDRRKESCIKRFASEAAEADRRKLDLPATDHDSKCKDYSVRLKAAKEDKQ